MLHHRHNAWCSTQNHTRFFPRNPSRQYLRVIASLGGGVRGKNGDAKRTLCAVAVAQDRSDLILRYAAKFASLLRHHGAIELLYALVTDTEEAFRKAAL